MWGGLRSAYRRVQISVAQKSLFTRRDTSLYKQRNRVLFFQKADYRFATSCNLDNVRFCIMMTSPVYPMNRPARPRRLTCHCKKQGMVEETERRTIMQTWRCGMTGTRGKKLLQKLARHHRNPLPATIGEPALPLQLQEWTSVVLVSITLNEAVRPVILLYWASSDNLPAVPPIQESGQVPRPTTKPPWIIRLWECACSSKYHPQHLLILKKQDLTRLLPRVNKPVLRRKKIRDIIIGHRLASVPGPSPTSTPRPYEI